MYIWFIKGFMEEGYSHKSMIYHMIHVAKYQCIDIEG